MQLVLEAELMSLMPYHCVDDKVTGLYKKAVAAAKKENRTRDTALAYELFADFLSDVEIRWMLAITTNGLRIYTKNGVPKSRVRFFQERPRVKGGR